MVENNNGEFTMKSSLSESEKESESSEEEDPQAIIEVNEEDDILNETESDKP